MTLSVVDGSQQVHTGNIPALDQQVHPFQIIVMRFIVFIVAVAKSGNRDDPVFPAQVNQAGNSVAVTVEDRIGIAGGQPLVGHGETDQHDAGMERQYILFEAGDALFSVKAGDADVFHRPAPWFEQPAKAGRVPILHVIFFPVTGDPSGGNGGPQHHDGFPCG